MYKQKKLIFSDEALDSIAAKAHKKIDYQKITQQILEKLPDLVTKAIRADLDNIIQSLPKPKDGKDGRDGRDGKEGLSHQEQQQIRADITEKVQENIQPALLDTVIEELADTFASKRSLKSRMDALTRFVKERAPSSAGISGKDMIEEIDKVLGEDWQTGGAEWGGITGGITGLLSNQTDLQSALDGKEPTFSKNTAFNKAFGTGTGQVAEGNALAAKITSPGSSQINEIFVAIDTNGNAKMVPVKIDPVTLKLSGLLRIETFALWMGRGNSIFWTEGGVQGGAISGDMFINTAGLFKLRHTAGQLVSIEANQNQVLIFPAVESSSVTTGAFVVNGGAGIAKNLHVGGNQFINTLKSGATQIGAGAAANEIWKTSGHATLPDNVLIIGV
jgi:hypothetical protein